MTDRGHARAGWLVLVLALVAVLVPVCVQRQFLSGDAILYDYDHAQLQYPRYAILCNALQHEGSFPLWERPLYAGAPFHANPETPTLYPPVLLLAAFLPPVLVMNLTILLHLSLAGLGMFLLVRRLWRRFGGGELEGAVGSLLAALVFSCCHFTRLEHWNLVAYGAAHALIPWILIATDALLHGPVPRRAAGALALLLAAQVFTGGLYVYAYTGLALLVWVAVECAGGGRELRRRALRWGGAAALAAALLAAAKLAPFPHWAATSNRSGALSADALLGKTLGGQNTFAWAEVWHNVGLRTGVWALLLLPLALPLLRRATVLAAVLLLLLGFGVAVGGPLHTALAALPPFDRIRNADRAWTLTNVALPLLAGLGWAWVLSLLGGARDARPDGATSGSVARRALVLACGAALALVLLPSLLQSGQYTRSLAEPLSMRDVLATRYPHWQDVASRRDGERAMQIDVQSPGGRNEQFVATALGLEIVGGLLGDSWPVALARHAYREDGGPLVPELRLRRLGVLAVTWLVTGHQSPLPVIVLEDALQQDSGAAWPPGIDGTDVQHNPWARPRAEQPAGVVGVFGDRNAAAQYALLDLPAFPMLAASVLDFSSGEPPTRDELAALDDIVIVAGGDPVAPDVAAELAATERDHPERVHHLTLPLQPESHDVLLAVARRLASLGAARALDVSRPTAGELLVAGAPPSRDAPRDVPHDVPHDASHGRWVVLAETFALHGGWQARSAGQAVPLRRADGVASAALLPSGATTLSARYAPPEVRLGWILGAAGLLFAAWLLLSRPSVPVP